jgi:hypothetical protein
VRLLKGFLAPPVGSRVIPRAVAEFGGSFVAAAAGVLLDVIDEPGVVVGRVRVDERLLESVNNNPGRGQLDLDVRVGDAIGLAGVKGDVDAENSPGREWSIWGEQT